MHLKETVASGFEGANVRNTIQHVLVEGFDGFLSIYHPPLGLLVIAVNKRGKECTSQANTVTI